MQNKNKTPGAQIQTIWWKRISIQVKQTAPTLNLASLSMHCAQFSIGVQMMLRTVASISNGTVLTVQPSSWTCAVMSIRSAAHLTGRHTLVQMLATVRSFIWCLVSQSRGTKTRHKNCNDWILIRWSESGEIFDATAANNLSQHERSA